MDRKEQEEAIKKLQETLGDPLQILAQQIINLSMNSNLCDVCFHDKEPALDVKIDQRIGLALMYGAGPKKLQELLTDIRLSDGDVVSIGDIWMVFPLPPNGITAEALAATDLADGDVRSGPSGETVREMIRNLYHCKTAQEEEKYLRRYLAT